ERSSPVEEDASIERIELQPLLSGHLELARHVYYRDRRTTSNLRRPDDHLLANDVLARLNRIAFEREALRQACRPRSTSHQRMPVVGGTPNLPRMIGSQRPDASACPPMLMMISSIPGPRCRVSTSVPAGALFTMTFVLPPPI